MCDATGPVRSGEARFPSAMAAAASPAALPAHPYGQLGAFETRLSRAELRGEWLEEEAVRELQTKVGSWERAQPQLRNTLAELKAQVGALADEIGSRVAQLDGLDCRLWELQRQGVTAAVSPLLEPLLSRMEAQESNAASICMRMDTIQEQVAAVALGDRSRQPPCVVGSSLTSPTTDRLDELERASSEAHDCLEAIFARLTALEGAVEQDGLRQRHAGYVAAAEAKHDAEAEQGWLRRLELLSTEAAAQHAGRPWCEEEGSRPASRLPQSERKSPDARVEAHVLTAQADAPETSPEEQERLLQPRRIAAAEKRLEQLEAESGDLASRLRRREGLTSSALSRLDALESLDAGGLQRRLGGRLTVLEAKVSQLELSSEEADWHSRLDAMQSRLSELEGASAGTARLLELARAADGRLAELESQVATAAARLAEAEARGDEGLSSMVERLRRLEEAPGPAAQLREECTAKVQEARGLLDQLLSSELEVAVASLGSRLGLLEAQSCSREQPAADAWARLEEEQAALRLRGEAARVDEAIAELQRQREEEQRERRALASGLESRVAEYDRCARVVFRDVVPRLGELTDALDEARRETGVLRGRLLAAEAEVPRARHALAPPAAQAVPLLGLPGRPRGTAGDQEVSWQDCEEFSMSKIGIDRLRILGYNAHRQVFETLEQCLVTAGQDAILSTLQTRWGLRACSQTHVICVKFKRCLILCLGLDALLSGLECFVIAAKGCDELDKQLARCWRFCDSLKCASEVADEGLLGSPANNVDLLLDEDVADEFCNFDVAVLRANNSWELADVAAVVYQRLSVLAVAGSVAAVIGGGKAHEEESKEMMAETAKANAADLESSRPFLRIFLALSVCMAQMGDPKPRDQGRKHYFEQMKQLFEERLKDIALEEMGQTVQYWS
ncbi:unnamed protein product [Prorocentrum cordatum]|uniref:Uncharacterized protein n=1 Tax=Prorocentrum cordatum TaxID=2364126 RepID=A0ABN9VS26_9DINO|nr:unnamed protein product [Polarella glacialis]